MNNQAVCVHSISQEYWYIKRDPCVCGGQFEKEMQELILYNDNPSDRLMTKCSKCGLTREFIFDISAFFGDKVRSEEIKLLMLLKQVKDVDEEMRAKIYGILGSPVANSVRTILQCGEKGDLLALDWLEDAIRYARSAKNR